MKITECLQTEVAQQCDVLVCGGGFAGISAALAAARRGKKTVLLERQFMLGGLGTAGLVTIYLPLCDGLGRQVSFGIAEELLRLSIVHGAEARYPKNWLDSNDPAKRTEKDPRFEVQYNAQLFAILAEQLLLSEGVQILYGTYAVGTHIENDRIEAVFVENKSGRQAIACRTVIDATGDCDIAWFANAPTALHQDGNVMAAWYYSVAESEYRLNLLGFCDVPEGAKEVNKVELSNNRRYGGVDGTEVSEFMQQSHASTLNHVLKQKKESGKQIWPVTLATVPQFRMTRRLVGEYELDISESHAVFEDSVGLIANWRKREPVYEVPFRTLYSSKMKNLLTAGRCISVTDAMWDISRVIPCCAVTGEAAGVAAAMSEDFTTLSVPELQAELRKNGVVLHESEL